jgi:hypothetical protein
MIFNANYLEVNDVPIPGGLSCRWSTWDIPHGATKLAIRYVTPVTEDNQLGFKEVTAVKPITIGRANPGGFPSGQEIAVYGQPQDDKGNDIGFPTGVVNTIAF